MYLVENVLKYRASRNMQWWLSSYKKNLLKTALFPSPTLSTDYTPSAIQNNLGAHFFQDSISHM